MINAKGENSNKFKFKVKSSSEKSYNLTLLYKDENFVFTFEDMADFPVKIYELKGSLKELKEIDENFFIFKNTTKLVLGIKACIDLGKYSMKLDEEENIIIFEIKKEFFENGKTIIKIPKKEQN